MDDGSPHRFRDARVPAPDLASIVLASRVNVEPDGHEARRAVAPEAVPLDARPGIGAGGFDARSVIVLALVVAVLAAVIGWVATGRDDGSPELSSSSSSSVATKKAEQGAEAKDAGSKDATPAATTVGDGADAPASAAHGVDLAIGRVLAGTGGASGASVVVGVTNHGDVDFAAADDATLLVLVDGAIGATVPLPALEAGSATRVDVVLDWCPAGTVPVTVVLDPRASVRELDERNGATSRAVDFAC